MPSERPRIWEWCGFGLFVFVAIAFGVVVELRSAFMQRRMTDFDVYTAAAWAARTGRDIYEVTNEDRLHYCYPPTFAVLMAPLAEPADQSRQRGYLPFPVSVGIWYVLSVGFLFASAHLLANALEGSSDRPPDKWDRRWWALRMWPILLTLPSIGATLSHGQVNLLLLLLLVGCLTAAMAAQTWKAGCWLAGAIALKVIPAFLILVPILRKDRRWLGGLVVGLIVLLLGIPALMMGPVSAWQANRKFIDVMINPALRTDHRADRALEMFHVLRTDNQSPQAVLHAWKHRNDPHAPPQPDAATRTAHWLIGLVVTSITIAAMRGSRLLGSDLALAFSALIVVMLMVSPMTHLHYYCLTLPLVATLLHREWDRRGQLWPGWKLFTMLAVHVLGVAIPLIAHGQRNLGFAPLATLPLWFLAVQELWVRPVEGTVSLPFSRPSIQRKAA
jgi:hypothetical protein